MKIILCSREEKDNALSHGAVLCTEEEADFLMHFRTRGSKNGIRRWQYEDGSLTPEGYIHYGIGQGNKYAKKAEKYEKKSEKLEKKASKALRSSGRTHVLNTILKRKNGEKSDLLSLRTGVKLTKAAKNSMRANRFERKAKRFEKKAKEQEEKGRAEFEKDKKRNKELDMAHEEFTENKEHDDALRDVPKDIIKERIQTTNDWFNDEQYDTPEMRVQDLKNFTDNFDKHRDLARKNEGDNLLSYLYEKSEKFAKKTPNEVKDNEEFKEFDDLQWWLNNKIREKSGYWDAGGFKRGSHAEKASKTYEKAVDDEFEYRDKVKNSLGIRGETFSMSSKDSNRLLKALEKDSTWKQISKASKDADNDLRGAILKDLGFRDTPENRFIIGFFDYID